MKQQPWYALVTWWADTPESDDEADELADSFYDGLPDTLTTLPGVIRDSVRVMECNSPLAGNWPAVHMEPNGESEGWPS